MMAMMVCAAIMVKVTMKYGGMVSCMIFGGNFQLFVTQINIHQPNKLGSLFKHSAFENDIHVEYTFVGNC
jgi:uncharacterized membrane protein YqhA